MAEIVLGFASSHGPTMGTPPERWAELGKKDEIDARMDWEELLRTARPGLEQEVTLEKFRERYNTVQKAVDVLGAILHEAGPDVVVVFSNPHGGVGYDLMQPTFGVHLSEEPPFTEAPRRPYTEAPARATPGPAPQPSRARDAVQYPTHEDLAHHLMDGLIEEGIDVAANFQSRPGFGLDGAYNLLYHRYDRDATLPYVPLLLSRYRPNQATPRRCYEFGQAVRRVIDRWDSPMRVAVMGSGGLSHQVVDEELDHMVIEALEQGDTEALFSIDRDRLNRAPGTPEILNWLACAGVMAPKTMTLIDYVPCYRSLAGTGHGNTFGFWR